MARLPTDPATTVITFCVRVHVLSVQTTLAFVIVSQLPSTLTGRFSAVIFFVANANAKVTARGRPSGKATTIKVIEMMRI